MSWALIEEEEEEKCCCKRTRDILEKIIHDLSWMLKRMEDIDAKEPIPFRCIECKKEIKLDNC